MARKHQTEGSGERQRAGGDAGRASQQQAARDRHAANREHMRNPENVIGTDAYAQKNKLPPYDKD